MAVTRTKRGTVVAREKVVIVVGARPVEYGRIVVTDRRTGERVEIADTDKQPIDPGDDGVPYVFRAGEKVRANHPAVEASPGAFISLDEAEDLFPDDPVS